MGQPSDPGPDASAAREPPKLLWFPSSSPTTLASADRISFAGGARRRGCPNGVSSMSVHAKMKTHISKTAQRLEDEVESRPWHGWPGIIAWRWVGRANKLDINFFGHKLGASANMIYWF